VAQVENSPRSQEEAPRLDAPPVDYLQLPAPAACQLHGEEGAIVGSWSLRVQGRSFVSIYGHVERVDAAVGAEGARAVVRTRGITLGGDVAIDELRVRPVEPLAYEGWLHVRRMRVVQVGGDGVLRGEVLLPAMLADRPMSVDVPCSKVLLTGEVRAPQDGQEARFEASTSVPLRLQPGGDVVATLRAIPASASDELVAVEWTYTQLLERRGAWAHVRVIGPNSWVEGWTDGSALKKGGFGGMLGMLSGGGASGERSLRCPRELLLYVRPEAEPVRVGVVSAGATVRVRSTAPLARLAAQAEVPVELGNYDLWSDDGRPSLQAFVMGDALAGCELSPIGGADTSQSSVSLVGVFVTLIRIS
jgi:hypothetical protein